MKDIQGILLTGDRRLRNLAQSQGIQVHGILWVLDTLLDFDVLSYSTAEVALELMRSKGSFLPDKEIQKRLKDWKGKG